MKGLKKGDMIPDFALQNQYEEIVEIGNYLGKKNLVIYFYPKDGSLTCTRQACYFRDYNHVFEETDTEVIGISQQSTLSHRKFAESNDLNFHLLSDPDNSVRKMFGVPSKLFGLVAGRVTYIVDKNRKIVNIFNSQTNVQGHIDEALRVSMVLKKSNSQAKE